MRGRIGCKEEYTYRSHALPERRRGRDGERRGKEETLSGHGCLLFFAVGGPRHRGARPIAVASDYHLAGDLGDGGGELGSLELDLSELGLLTVLLHPLLNLLDRGLQLLAWGDGKKDKAETKKKE